MTTANATSRQQRGDQVASTPFGQIDRARVILTAAAVAAGAANLLAASPASASTGAFAHSRLARLLASALIQRPRDQRNRSGCCTRCTREEYLSASSWRSCQSAPENFAPSYAAARFILWFVEYCAHMQTEA